MLPLSSCQFVPLVLLLDSSRGHRHGHLSQGLKEVLDADPVDFAELIATLLCGGTVYTLMCVVGLRLGQWATGQGKCQCGERTDIDHGGTDEVTDLERGA